MAHHSPQYQGSRNGYAVMYADRSSTTAPAFNPLLSHQHHGGRQQPLEKSTHARHVRKHYTRPKPSYVLLGRGRSNIKHPGNIFFNELVEKCFSEYSVSTMERKKEIVAGILAKLEKNGGGFRQYDPKTQQYLCLNDEMSRQKVMHAIQHRIRLIKKKETTESVKESTVANVKTTQSANACREKVHQPPSPLAAAQQFVSPPPLFPQQPKLASVLTVPPHYKSAVNVPARFGSEASSHVHNNDQPGCLYERIGDSLLQAFLDPTWQPMYSSMALKDDTFGEDLVEDIARRALEDVRKLRSRRNNNRRRPSLGVGKPETIR